MTHADYHPCSEGCGRDSELPGPCEECDMRRRLPPTPGCARVGRHKTCITDPAKALAADQGDP